MLKTGHAGMETKVVMEEREGSEELGSERYSGEVEE